MVSPLRRFVRATVHSNLIVPSVVCRAGNGGSIMQWCPEHELAIGYVPNLMHLTMLGDERSMNLTLKVMEGVEKREGKAKI